MKRKFFFMGAICLFLLVITGCGEKEFQPVPINPEVDTCEVCNMMVPDDHNASEILLKDGKVLKFDDIGDLYVWKKEHGSEQIAVQYVRDYHTAEWIKLEEATFVYDREFKTPMAFGVYSFKDKAEAEAFVKEQGRGQLMSAADLDNHHWEHNEDMRGGHGHGHGHDGNHAGHDHGHSEHEQHAE